MEKVFHSHAKINLGLFLLNRRNDGYHDIATVFQQISIFDTLTFQKNKSHQIIITCNNTAIPLDERNLIWRSFDVYRTATGIQDGLSVHLEKHIPAGGGLGGGSSNAAATLLACEALWKQPASLQEKHRMAFEIGSDVPFFLSGGTALGLGRGERLTPLQLPVKFWIVLVFPEFSVSTQWAYSQTRIGLTNVDKISTLRALFDKSEVHAWRELLVNELEAVVFERHPELHEIKVQLYDKDAFYASMSGSGSTMFGLFEDRSSAEGAVQFFSKMHLRASLAQPVSGHSPSH
ncbi:4-(cytidine 5'-diphospho)-2-C-methyl-D-erythritol kinase [bacterium]|nr:4-(cytidine 5'-diphospho)-2-C-methyl-D-erythritol kinase [bacterium]